MAEVKPEGLDYESHPSQLVAGGTLNAKVGVQQLRDAIPAHCFKPKYTTSFYYLFRDLALAAGLGYAAWHGIPKLPDLWMRVVAWTVYGYYQGHVCTGLWVLGHECGHSNFSPSNVVNDTVGFILHSALLTPYFSWKSSHRRHHIYANNLAKDHNYVPPTREHYAQSLLFDIQRLEELTEDSPIVTLLRILLQQVIGFPWYLITNITAAPGSLHRKQSETPLGNSHFLPWSTLFRPEEAHLIVLSDVGILSAVAGLHYLSSNFIGLHMLALMYVVPYMWVNHWIVAITYLHHTHPDLPKFENEAWTFLNGATATVDRSYGWVSRWLWHDIIDFHVVHHLFSRIPFYYGEEATRAIIPLLGEHYHSAKDDSFLLSLWTSFTKCQWVEPDKPTADPKDRVMWYKGGPSPPPETSMGIKGIKGWRVL